MILKQSVPDRNLAPSPVHIVRVHIDQERRIGISQELKQRTDHVSQCRFPKLSSGGREEAVSGDHVDEGEGRGDGDRTDAEVMESEVDVLHGREKEARVFRGSFEKVVTDGDGGDLGAWEERYDDRVEPLESVGAVCSNGRD